MGPTKSVTFSRGPKGCHGLKLTAKALENSLFIGEFCSFERFVGRKKVPCRVVMFYDTLRRGKAFWVHCNGGIMYIHNMYTGSHNLVLTSECLKESFASSLYTCFGNFWYISAKHEMSHPTKIAYLPQNIS